VTHDDIFPQQNLIKKHPFSTEYKYYGRTPRKPSPKCKIIAVLVINDHEDIERYMRLSEWLSDDLVILVLADEDFATIRKAR
jgi:hypothetical protein